MEPAGSNETGGGQDGARPIRKKRPRTSPRSRCPVRDHERNAIQVLYEGDVLFFSGLQERLLQMTQTEALQTSQGGRMAGVSKQKAVCLLQKSLCLMGRCQKGGEKSAYTATHTDLEVGETA